MLRLHCHPVSYERGTLVESRETRKVCVCVCVCARGRARGGGGCPAADAPPSLPPSERGRFVNIFDQLIRLMTPTYRCENTGARSVSVWAHQFGEPGLFCARKLKDVYRIPRKLTLESSVNSTEAEAGLASTTPQKCAAVPRRALI